MNGYPEKQGLYDPQFEHDSCGVGCIVNIKGQQSHALVMRALQLLANLQHRGALGADPTTGDGAGLLVQIPHGFFIKAAQKEGFSLPAPGEYGIGMVFLPKAPEALRQATQTIEAIIAKEGARLLGWRKVPTDPQHVGQHAAKVQPEIQQVFISKPAELSVQAFERQLYVIRKQIENAVNDSKQVYISSMSYKTLIYKGMLHAPQLRHFFLDFEDQEFASAIALVHSRFSTNTFPTWHLSHPFRYLAHNGEINTLRGNINWMNARQSTLHSQDYEEISKLFPIIQAGGSDSAGLDNALEFLTLSGYSLAHAMMLLVPEAWMENPYMTPEKEAFYEYYEHLMEPWDGPAALIFTDGIQVCATLDRNGLRPARYKVTKDGMVIIASEVGAGGIPHDQIEYSGRLRPGNMLMIDTQKGEIISDKDLKAEICSARPYAQWVKDHIVALEKLPEPEKVHLTDFETLLTRQKIFGYTTEDLNMLLTPMVSMGEEAVGSMGNDAPLAVLSDEPHLLYNYFKQLFAQVTNPPVDSIREELVMSLVSHLGPELNILEPGPSHARLLRLENPILSNKQLEQIRELNRPEFRSETIDIIFKAAEGPQGLKHALDEVCTKAAEAVKSNCALLILSDRKANAEYVPIPALLATAAVHHYLIRQGLRTCSGLILETGEAREVAHFAVLIGYGAGAINPYLAFETFEGMIHDKVLPENLTIEKAIYNYVKAVKKGLFKIFSKMGISTIQSYRGAQIFEAIGLSEEVVNHYFTGTPSRVSGIGLEEIAQESLMRHEKAYKPAPETANTLELGGFYFWRRRGEYHQVHPLSVQKLQEASQKNSREAYKEYSRLVNDQSRKLSTLRGLIEFKPGNPIPLEEVEPAKEIVKRFATGAMSFGSISIEAHEALAVAMNRIGARSNSGEGGENPDRFYPRENGDWAISNIKQVASGRFGVTIQYLSHCKELQIKIAQGAKPGEGGQLPGGKVSPDIAKVRYSTPGVSLISPPPHHDIYSIEDLAQLIFDLKNANPEARITVKLVAEAGVGTIAAGVAKAHADMIVICGHDGGTGASPLTSIKYAGIPWELGLADTHQTLLLNGLRSRVRLQTDGQIKTGREVVIGAMLGAEEFGFSTAPLITLGCIMMRKCHLNTCPVGVATQDPVLRAKFNGKPEYVINYFFMIAEEVREYMAQLGFRHFDEMVGRSDMLVQRQTNHWKAKKLNLSYILYRPELASNTKRYWAEPQNHGLENQIDHELIKLAQPAIEEKKPVTISMNVNNTNRSIGTMLSGRIAKRWGMEELPEDTIRCLFQGSAGQSFGAFLAKGVTLTLEGDANDYVGKGLSGGKLIVYPAKNATFEADKNIVIGNTVLYGATSGEAYFSGMAGERFAVRNSGAIAVVEGVGDHGCEYMTGGRAVVLGHTGRNFAAGMSGGIAYVYDEEGQFERYCNKSMVELGPLLEAEEQDWLLKAVQKHQLYTGSKKAQRLLADWPASLKRFVRVIPTEYRIVMEKLQKKIA